MFIWGFTTGLVLGQIMDWIYGQFIGFLGRIFCHDGQHGSRVVRDELGAGHRAVFLLPGLGALREWLIENPCKWQ